MIIPRTPLTLAAAYALASHSYAFDPAYWQLKTAVLTGDRPLGVTRTITFPSSSPFAYIASVSRSGQWLVPTNAGMFAWDLTLPSSALRLVRETGSQLPSTAGFATTYGPMSAPILDDANRVIGAAIPSAAINNTHTMNFVSLDGTTALEFARDNMPPPGDEPGPRLRSLSLPSVAPDGTVLFYGTPDNGTRTELWKWTPSGGRAKVLASGLQAPGFPAGWTLGEVQSDTFGPTINRSGITWTSAFLASSNPGVTSSNALVLFRGTTDQLQPLYRSGDMLPSGAIFRNFRAYSSNDAGDAVGLLYTGNGSTYRLAVFRGVQPFEIFNDARPLPGITPGTIVDFVSEIAMNNAGKIAFEAAYRPNALEGVWFGDEHALQAVALAGTSAPEWTDRVVRGIARGPFLNNRNDLLFVANLEDLSAVNAGQGLFYWHPDRGLAGLLRTGQQFEVRPGILKTIESFMLLNSSSVQDGYSIFLNDFGHFTFGINFTDATSGSFLITVPAPTGSASLLILLSLSARCRRR